MREFEEFAYCCPECYNNFILPTENEEETCLECGCMMYCMPLELISYFDTWRE